MLRLSSSTVRLRVVPGSVCGTIIHGWLRRRQLADAKHAFSVADDAYPAAGPMSAGLPVDEQSHAIDAVLADLAKATRLAGARLHVELADAFLHLDVVEGDFAASSDRQLQSVALACVAELLADAAARYDVRWQLQPGGRHLLIAAIAQSQLRALADIALRHGLILHSVQPDFCLQWNRHARALKPGSAVFAVASGREAVVARVCEGAVTAVSSGPWLDSHDDELHNARAQRLMCGLGLAPTSTAAVLDARVDRLLASAGTGVADQSAYVLVAPKVADKAVSSRWIVFDREGATP